MDSEQIAIARACFDAAYDGTQGFPGIIGTLLGAGFEGYAADYRRNRQTYYLPDGDGIDFDMPYSAGSVAAAFDSAEVGAIVRWAQADDPGYSYAAFSERAKDAGCAGYIVSFSGRRVVYYGRTAETHVELFPR